MNSIHSDPSFNRNFFQRVANHPELNNATRLSVVGNISSYRLRGLNLKRVNTFDMTEHKFTVTPYDLAHNLIGLRKAGMVKKLAEIGIPTHRNMTRLEVSDIDRPTYQE